MSVDNHIKGRLGANFAKLIGDHTFDQSVFYTGEIVHQEIDYGFDMTIKQQGYRSVNGKSEAYSTGRNIALQLKTTAGLTISGDEIIYPLDASNYRTIVDANMTVGATKSGLVIIEVPTILSDAIERQGEDVLLKVKAYRHIPEYDAEVYENQTSVTIRFSKTQVFDSDAIHHLYSQLFI